MDRRRFLFKAGLLAGTTALAAPLAAPLAGSRALAQTSTWTWRMTTSWDQDTPIMFDGAREFARRVGRLTSGRLRIEVHAAGDLAEGLEVFQAVSEGRVECGHSAAYWWADLVPAAQWFTSVPFGMDKEGYNAWFYAGQGLDLWREVYAPFGVRPYPLGDTGAQMFGWFRDPVRSVDDLAGLRMRVPGLAAKVLEGAGVYPVLTTSEGLAERFASGELDAVNWIGPHHDMLLGLNQPGVYYYGPGWQEPSGRLELIVNQAALDQLPEDLRQGLEVAAAWTDASIQARFEWANAIALKDIQADHSVRVRGLSEAFLNDMWRLTEETLYEITSADPLAAKVADDYSQTRDLLGRWKDFSSLVF